MAGLNSYYNTLNTYSSNLDGMTNFLGQYQQDALDDFNDKVAAVKEQGKALVETGGAIEGQYAAAKVLYNSYKAFRNRGKKPGNEDGDEDEDEDDEGGEGGGSSETNLDEAGDPDADASATGDAGESEVPGTSDAGADASAAGDSGESSAATAADIPEGAGGGADAATDVSSLGQSSAPLTESQASQFTADPVPEPEPPSLSTAYEAPDIPEAGQAMPKGLSSGGELQELDSTGAATGAESTTAAGTEGVSAAATETGDVVSSVVTEGGSDIAAGLLAGAGVAAEAVPVVGGLVALGIGLYELFHHHSKPPPKPTPTSIISQKGEMVVPSFDSVTDTPASQSAF
tara:strand:+ start:4976 stop:6007 length:1032 start_codon:yes stop_codon:yes gene_type:complete